MIVMLLICNCLCFGDIRTAAIQELLDSIHKRANDQIPRIMDLISSVGLQLARSSNARFLILSCFRLFPLSHCRVSISFTLVLCFSSRWFGSLLWKYLKTDIESL